MQCYWDCAYWTLLVSFKTAVIVFYFFGGIHSLALGHFKNCLPYEPTWLFRLHLEYLPWFLLCAGVRAFSVTAPWFWNVLPKKAHLVLKLMSFYPFFLCCQWKPFYLPRLSNKDCYIVLIWCWCLSLAPSVLCLLKFSFSITLDCTGSGLNSEPPWKHLRAEY